MKINIFLLGMLMVAFTSYSAFPISDHSHQSNYAGQETRAIKSLSKADIEDLKNGRGWGLAKAAELNGVPGPVHVLQMKNEINLSPEQVREIERQYHAMKKEAIPLGLELIELERKLNHHFIDHAISDELLRHFLEKISDVYQRLRYVHLAAHLKTPQVLSPEQIAQYNRLRGYASDDPCQNIPAGHDPDMWKRHRNCP